MLSKYCKKCSDEVRQHDVEPIDILDRNTECILCGKPKVCPKCSHEQDERFGDFPLFVCMDCIAEADRYLLGIAEVNQDINSTLRLREAQGWTPDHLVIDATLQDRGLHSMSLKPGVTLDIKPVPMVFAVVVICKRGTEVHLDFVELCPAPLRSLMMESLQNNEEFHGASLKPYTVRAQGHA
jgi:hypothetical protein